MTIEGLAQMYRKWNVCYNVLSCKTLSLIKATDRNEFVHIAFWRPFSYQEAHVLVLDHCRLGLPHLRYRTHQSHYGKHLHLLTTGGKKLSRDQNETDKKATRIIENQTNSNWRMWTLLGEQVWGPTYPMNWAAATEIGFNKRKWDAEQWDRKKIVKILVISPRDCKISWIKWTKRW